jgi:hypothetical protein
MNGLGLLLWIVGLLVVWGCVMIADAYCNAPRIAETDPAGISRFDALDGVGQMLSDSVAHEARMTARAERLGGAS